MRESFIFYKSFYDAIEDLDDKKRLKMYDAITKLALKNEEIDNLNGICKQLFILIKPQITANNKRFEDGKKGGRPTKEKTTGYFEKKPNNNVNENVNENNNVNVNENVEVLRKEKIDPFINPLNSFFQEEYQKVFNTIPFLSASDRNRLCELAAEYPNIRELIPQALTKLKNIEFKDIDFKPTATWLLKGNNFERVMNGEFEKQNTPSNKRGVSPETIKRCIENTRKRLEQEAQSG